MRLISSDLELSYGKYGNKQKIWGEFLFSILKATEEESRIRVRFHNSVVLDPWIWITVSVQK